MKWKNFFNNHLWVASDNKSLAKSIQLLSRQNKRLTNVPKAVWKHQMQLSNLWNNAKHMLTNFELISKGLGRQKYPCLLLIPPPPSPSPVTWNSTILQDEKVPLPLKKPTLKIDKASLLDLISVNYTYLSPKMKNRMRKDIILQCYTLWDNES